MPTLRTVSSSLLFTLAVAACSSDEASFDAAPVRTTTEKSESSVAGVVNKKIERTVTEYPSPADEAPSPPADEQPVQAGLLTAGDHDDLLNADLYAAYASDFLQRNEGDLPFVDTRSRVAVKVVDRAGRAVPFAKVRVQRPGSPLDLVAAADGTASFYPAFDRVPRKTMSSVRSGSDSASRSVALPSAQQRDIVLTLPSAGRPVSAMDLMLVIDTTGSMGDELSYLQAEIDSIVERLKRTAGNLDLRVGLVFYRDEGDQYVVRSTPLTSNIGSVRTILARQEADGGGDTPEALDQAIAAADRMQWRPNAAKAMLLVADAPPHREGLSATLAAAQRLRSKGVQVVPVAASGVEDNAQYVMRTMAALTQGRYIFLTDDSGVGNAHADPDVACFVVTRLDQLIVRVLGGIAEGRRIEPGRDEVIRVVGDYDRGRCIRAGAANQS